MVTKVRRKMNKNLLIFTSKKNALLLSAFASVCTLLVSLTYVYTAPLIEQQAQQDLLNKLNQVLVPERFDNNPLENCLHITDKSIFGDDESHVIYRATQQEQPYALVFQTQTLKGYNGLIKLMVAIDKTGKVQGVRTLQHKETPGLGDKIDLEKSNWVLSFNDMKVNSDTDKRWFVKKDGGYFDQFTGATITPRAVVNQLRQSIRYVSSNFDRLFVMENQCVVDELLPPDSLVQPITTDPQSQLEEQKATLTTKDEVSND